MKREKNESTIFLVFLQLKVVPLEFGKGGLVLQNESPMTACLFNFVILKLSCEILFAYYAIKFQLLQTLETEF